MSFPPAGQGRRRPEAVSRRGGEPGGCRPRLTGQGGERAQKASRCHVSTQRARALSHTGYVATAVPVRLSLGARGPFTHGGAMTEENPGHRQRRR